MPLRLAGRLPTTNLILAYGHSLSHTNYILYQFRPIVVITYKRKQSPSVCIIKDAHKITKKKKLGRTNSSCTGFQNLKKMLKPSTLSELNYHIKANEPKLLNQKRKRNRARSRIIKMIDKKTFFKKPINKIRSNKVISHRPTNKSKCKSSKLLQFIRNS